MSKDSFYNVIWEKIHSKVEHIEKDKVCNL